MKFLSKILLATLLIAGPAMGQPMGETTNAWEGQPGDKELVFLVYFFSRAETSNLFPSNDLLMGQTVGRLFGSNTTIASEEERTFFTEQRAIPFIIYRPRVLDGFALLRASFELDWTWGDAAYGTGGNFGGALSADQVNLQTQNLQIELRVAKNWYLDLGLQRLYDTPRDPYRTFFSTLTLTGQRLAFWGSDAVGAVIHGRTGPQKHKFGIYQLYENNIQQKDDVLLFEAATNRYLFGTWHLGANARYLRDRASGEGGVGIWSQGLNSSLAEMMGAYRFPFGSARYEADIVWLGLETSVNPELNARRWGGSAFAVANLGQARTETSADNFTLAAKILGVAANGRLGFRYGRTPDDHITLEGMFASGDGNGLKDKQYNGVITGNTWGAPAAVYTGHGLYLLLPHILVVNRYYAAVTDISNMGYGLSAAMVQLSRDLVRNRLQMKTGAGAGYSNARPSGGGRTIGYEVNGMLSYRVRAFFNIGLHAAHLWVGDFYRSPAVVDKDKVPWREDKDLPYNPWTVFATLSWLMF